MGLGPVWLMASQRKFALGQTSREIGENGNQDQSNDSTPEEHQCLPEYHQDLEDVGGGGSTHLKRKLDRLH